MKRLLLALSLVFSLTACDQIQRQVLGEDPAAKAARQEAEGKAVGGACRHALRGLEDCFTLNPKAAKAQVFAGWKEMDQYMRENKLEGAPSVLTQLEQKPAAAPARSPEGDEEDPPRSSRKRG